MMISMRRSLLLLGASATVASGFGTDGPRDQWRTEAELGELPKEVAGKLYVRISAHIYNHEIDYKALGSAVSTMCNMELGTVTVCTMGGGCA